MDTDESDREEEEGVDRAKTSGQSSVPGTLYVDVGTRVKGYRKRAGARAKGKS